MLKTSKKVPDYSKALRCTFFGELKSSCSSKLCMIRSVVCNTVFKNKKSVQLKVSTLQQVFVYLKYLQCAKMCKNVQKCAKMCKNVHLKCFWILFKNVHCQGPCSLRPCISRPYCTLYVYHLTFKVSRTFVKNLQIVICPAYCSNHWLRAC